MERDGLKVWGVMNAFKNEEINRKIGGGRVWERGNERCEILTKTEQGRIVVSYGYKDSIISCVSMGGWVGLGVDVGGR